MQTQHKPAAPVLKVDGLTKRFAGVVANDNISLEIGPNEILAIIGENGAGKSTFCKMLTGIYTPDAGDIYINGKKLVAESAADSLSAGIAMVYQERNLIGLLNGAQNVCFGHEPTSKRMIDEKTIMLDATALRDKLGLTVPLDIPVEQLGAGSKQLIEIMRAFYLAPKLLILDEPTASLGEGEIEPFLKFIKEIKNSLNISVIFISHKIEEVFEISDHIAVFTDGRCVMTSPTKDITQKECINAMLRSDTMKPIVVPPKDYEALKPVLRMESAVYDGREHELPVTARRGEVVGMYGLVGSGRTESMEVLYGLRRADSAQFWFNGETLGKTTPLTMIQKGMIMTPELRANAIVREFSLVDNIGNLFLEKKLASRFFGFINFDKERKFAEYVLEKNNVKYSDLNQQVIELSGGNMQKLIIGRSVEVEDMCLLVLDEPTTGMDIGAKNEIYHKVRRLADEDDVAVVFISSELEELLSVCDRLYVYANGSVVNSFVHAEFDKATIIETAVRGHKL